MSTIEDNKHIALRWFDLVTQGRVEELCAMTAPTWMMHGGPPSLPAGPDGIRALFATYSPWLALPDEHAGACRGDDLLGSADVDVGGELDGELVGQEVSGEPLGVDEHRYRVGDPVDRRRHVRRALALRLVDDGEPSFGIHPPAQ